MISAAIPERPPMLRGLATGVVSMLLSGVAFGQQQLPGVYKWADAKGIVHYDDENLLQPRLTQDILDGRKIAPVESVRVPLEFRAMVVQQCDLIRERVTNYRGARALYGRDPFGNVYLMSPNQVALTIAGLERDQSRVCTHGSAEKLYAVDLAKTKASDLDRQEVAIKRDPTRPIPSSQ